MGLDRRLEYKQVENEGVEAIGSEEKIETKKIQGAERKKPRLKRMARGASAHGSPPPPPPLESPPPGHGNNLSPPSTPTASTPGHGNSTCRVGSLPPLPIGSSPPDYGNNPRRPAKPADVPGHKGSFDTAFIYSRILSDNHAGEEFDLIFAECGCTAAVKVNGACQMELLDRKPVCVAEAISLATAIFWDPSFVLRPRHTLNLAKKLGLKTREILPKRSANWMDYLKTPVPCATSAGAGCGDESLLLERSPRVSCSTMAPPPVGLPTLTRR